MIIISSISISVLVIIIFIGIFFLLSKSPKEEKYKCDKGENDKCLTCDDVNCGSCNYGYELIKGKCIPTFSFKATYETVNHSEPVDLMDNYYLDKIIKIDIDEKNVEPCANYTFDSPGKHNIYVTLNTTNLTSLIYMFLDIKKMTSVIFTQNFYSSNINNMELMFFNCHKLVSIDISHFNIEKLETMRNAFYGCTSLVSLKLPSTKAPNLKDLGNAFYGCSNLTSIDLSSLYPGNLKDLIALFYGCYSLTSVDLSNFNTQNVTDMKFLFYNCHNLKSVNITHFNTESVKEMSYMFYGCNSLTSVDLSNFSIKKANKIDNMFHGCKSLSYLDISYFNKTLFLEVENFAKGISATGIIKANKKFFENIKEYFEGWEKELID